MPKQFLSNILVDTLTLPDGSTVLQVVPYAGVLLGDGQGSVPTGGRTLAQLMPNVDVSRAVYMRVSVTDQNIRWRVKGGAGNVASPTVGEVLPASGVVVITGATNIANFTCAAMTQNANVFVQVFG